MFRRSVLRAIGALAASATLFLVAGPAEAARFRFGPDETLHVIAPTGLVHDGKAISLCYKTVTYFLLAGVYTTDEYVLCEGGTSKKYWPLPAAEVLAGLQQQGQLPSPLPAYKRDAFDYVLGYSLWLVVAVVAVGGFFADRSSKAKKRQVLERLKLSARRVMAYTAASAGGHADRSRALASEIYLSLFREPLQEDAFAADMAWVYQEQTAFDGYLGAIGRNLDMRAKVILLRAAAHVAMADGRMDGGEEGALRHLADRLGLKPADTEGFLNSLRRGPTAAAMPSA